MHFCLKTKAWLSYRELIMTQVACSIGDAKSRSYSHLRVPISGRQIAVLQLPVVLLHVWLNKSDGNFESWTPRQRVSKVPNHSKVQRPKIPKLIVFNIRLTGRANAKQRISFSPN